MREQERLSCRLARVASRQEEGREGNERQEEGREGKPSSGERFGVVERFLPPATSSTSEEELRGDILKLE